MNGREWVVAPAVVREPRGYQARVEFSIAEVRMGWNTDPEQAAPVVVRGINQTRGDFPVDVLSLPGAAANQNHRYGGVCNVFVADSASNLVYGQTLVDYVAGIDRSVHHVAGHHLDEPVLVLLILLMVVTDEYLASSRSSHCLAPDFAVWDGDSVARGATRPAPVSDRHTWLASA